MLVCTYVYMHTYMYMHYVYAHANVDVYIFTYLLSLRVYTHDTFINMYIHTHAYGISRCRTCFVWLLGFTYQVLTPAPIGSPVDFSAGGELLPASAQRGDPRPAKERSYTKGHGAESAMGI